MTYFLGSERSTDSFLVFANCSMAGGARLLPDADWTQPGSAYDGAGMALAQPAKFKLDVTNCSYFEVLIPALFKPFPPEL